MFPKLANIGPTVLCYFVLISFAVQFSTSTISFSWFDKESLSSSSSNPGSWSPLSNPESQTLDGEIGAPSIGERPLLFSHPPLEAWVRVCRLRSQFRLNSFPQDPQLYGLMSVWVRRWVLRLLRWLNVLPQVEHLWGESSICKIRWTARVRDWQNPLPQSVHLKGFSFECMYLQKKNNFV